MATDLNKYFEPISAQAWEELAKKTLKGRPLEKLDVKTEDGFVLKPLYTSGPDVPKLAAPQQSWEPVAIVESSEDVGARADTEFDRGCNTIWVRGGQAIGEVGERTKVILDASNVADAKSSLSGVANHEIYISPLRGLFSESATKPANGAACVSTLEAHEAGTTAAMELGLALAEAVHIARTLEDSGEAVTWQDFPIVVGVTTNVFEEIAKLRALRWLWKSLMKTIGETNSPKIHAVASRRTLASVDVWSNAIRATVQEFAAAVGGADRISVYPHDARMAERAEAGERLSTTSQHVLAFESHLQQVADAAHGSYLIDTWTKQLAEYGWSYFQHIERFGGLESFFKDGRLHDELEGVIAEREARYAKRKQTRVGVNEFAVAGELAELEHTPLYVEAQGWETLQRKNRQAPPKVFLANLGPLAAHKPRADFVTRLFQAAGFEVVSNTGFDTADACAKAFADSGAKGYVLCGRDDDYETLGKGVVQAIDAKYAVYAGRPADEATWREVGVTHFVSMRVNVFEAVSEISEVAK